MAEYDTVIPPGQTGKIIAKMNTKKYRGKQTKSITVVTNDPENSQISLKLKCSIMGIKMLPVARAYFNAQLGKSTTQELSIATVGEGAITAYAIASKPYIIIKLVKLTNKKPTDESEYWKQYKLSITIPDNFPEGRFAESVTLTTDSQYDRTIKIPVAGVVNPTVVVSPSTVRMRTNNNSDFPQKKIKVTKKYGTGFKILQVITDPAQLKSELKETKKGKQYSISLTWTDIKSKGEFHGKVVIHSNDEQKSVISVPVIVTVNVK